MRKTNKCGRVSACLMVFVLALCLYAGAAAETLSLVSVTADKAQAPLGETLTWTASAAGDGVLSYGFSLYSHGGLVRQTGFSASPQFSYTPAEAGWYWVRAEATDGTAAVSLWGGAARIYMPLTATSVTSNGASGVAGNRIVWTAAAAGGAGERIWKFELFKDGVPFQASEYTEERRFSFTPSEAGVYKVLVTVKDDTGEATLESADVTVAPPLPLTLASVESNRTASVIGKRILWKARASGGTGQPDDRTFKFDLYKNGGLVLEGIFGASRVYGFTPAEAGVYKVRASVTDTTGAVSSLESAEVTVTEVPELAVVRLEANRSETIAGRKITWHVKATGGTGSKTYSFELFRDSVSVQVTAFKRSVTFIAAPAEPGVYHVRATVRDGSGTTAFLDSSVVTVTARPALSVLSVRADKAAAYAGRRITWNTKAAGGEGGKAYQFALYIDGTLVRTTEFRHSSAFSCTPAAPGDYKVIVTVKDSTGTASLESSPVTVTEKPAAGSRGRNRR
jgi:hypothetical protein